MKCSYRDRCYPTGENWENPCGPGNECETDFWTGEILCRCKRGLRGDRCQEDVNECEVSVEFFWPKVIFI